MTNTAATSSAAASAAVISVANAIKASGPIIQVHPQDFLNILQKSPDPIVVQSPSGIFTKNKYITSYKGLYFYTKTKDPLIIPMSTEIINAKKIYIPEM